MFFFPGQGERKVTLSTQSKGSESESLFSYPCCWPVRPEQVLSAYCEKHEANSSDLIILLKMMKRMSGSFLFPVATIG